MVIFIDLPGEIRNIIYNEIRTDTATNPGKSNSGLGMWTTSKQLHWEVASNFYQHGHFTTTLPTTQTYGATILPPIADRYLKHLRQLTFRTTVGKPNSADTNKVAGSIAALGNIGATLKVLRFEFSSKTSKALGRCVDDPVLHMDHPITSALRTIILSGIAKVVQVELKNVWFASGVLDELRSGLGNGQLEVFTTTEDGKTERPLIGYYSTIHLGDFGLDEQDCRDAEDLQGLVSDGDSAGSIPSSLSTALSDLDRFFIAEYLDEDPEGFQDFLKHERTDSLFDEPIFEIQDIVNPENADEGDNGCAEHSQATTLDEEELTEEDDIEDEEMVDINNVDAIIGHMEAVGMQKVNMEDICYMTNFAPDLLGKWVEKSA